MSRWTDQFVGDRMAVDRAFSERVAASEFSSQEWGTIMTAVELEIENPEDPESARVVADTGKIDQVMPALDEMRQNLPGAGAAAAGSSPGSSAGGSSGGLWFSIKRHLGLASSSEDHRTESAAALAEEYARQFQDHLQEQGKWERARRVAAESDGGERGLDEADLERTSEGSTGHGDSDDQGDAANHGDVTTPDDSATPADSATDPDDADDSSTTADAEDEDRTD